MLYDFDQLDDQTKAAVESAMPAPLRNALKSLRVPRFETLPTRGGPPVVCLTHNWGVRFRPLPFEYITVGDDRPALGPAVREVTRRIERGISGC